MRKVATIENTLSLIFYFSYIAVDFCCQDDGKVIEDIYISKSGQDYLKRGYQAVDSEDKKKETLRNKQLAIKRVPRREAKTVVVDIRICCKAHHNSTAIPPQYTKLRQDKL